MEFALTKKQTALRERAATAIADVVVPIVSALEPGAKLDSEAMRRLYRGLAPTGYVGSTIPQDAGGAGLTYMDYGLLLEALAPSPILLSEVVPPRSIYNL